MSSPEKATRALGRRVLLPKNFIRPVDEMNHHLESNAQRSPARHRTKRPLRACDSNPYACLAGRFVVRLSTGPAC